MGIPKIIWQTGKEPYEELSEQVKGYISSWKSKNLDWEYRYLSDDQLYEWVALNYGQDWLDVLNDCQIGVIKADVARVLFLHAGGLYTDLDTICNNPIKEWLDVDSTDLFLTSESECSIQNWCMASAPNHPFVESLMRYIRVNFIFKIKRDFEHFVTAHAGAGIIARCMERFLSVPHLFNWMDENRQQEIDNHALVQLHKIKIILGNEGREYLRTVHVTHLYASIHEVGITNSWRIEEKIHDPIPTFNAKNYFSEKEFLTYTDWIDHPNRHSILPNYRTSIYNADEMPMYYKEVFEINIAVNPEWTIVYFNDNDQINYIKRFYGEGVEWEAYDSLIPGAYKADLFRYLLLYSHGGWWSDICQAFLVPANSIIENNIVAVVCKDSILALHYALYNAVIYSRFPNHPMMKALIDESITRIKNKDYGRGSLDITGPEMMGKVVYEKFSHLLGESIKVLVFHYTDMDIMDLDLGKYVIQPRVGGNKHYKFLYSSKNKNQHYSVHHANRTVYK